MTLKELQLYQQELYKQRGYKADIMTVALGLCEEVGEIASVVNAYHNPLYIKREDKNVDGLEHELKDALIYLSAVASMANIDLSSLFDE